jgi:hypothetical protein
MPAFKVTSLKLDVYSSSDEDLTPDESRTLHRKVCGKVFIVDSEDDIVEAVTDYSDYCVERISYEQVPSVEVTVYGLFGGEVNTTDKRFEVPILGKKTDLAIIRAVKYELGWNNIPCNKQDYGDYIRLEPRGRLQCADIETVY